MSTEDACLFALSPGDKGAKFAIIIIKGLVSLITHVNKVMCTCLITISYMCSDFGD